MKNKLAGLPSVILDQVLAEQKLEQGRAGNSAYSEFWAGFDKRALAKRKELDDNKSRSTPS